MSSCHRGFVRGAFTLVELLVVLGVVAVLTAILLPVLGAARERAQATQCASNIRQVVLAMAAYEADHRSYPLLYSSCYGKAKWQDMTLDKCWVDALLEMGYLRGPDLPRNKLGVLGCPAVDDGVRDLHTIDPGIVSRCPDYGYNAYVNLPAVEMRDPFYRQVSFHGRRGRMARDAARKVLMTETWSYAGYWDTTTSRVWSTGHGDYATEGGGWLNAVGHPNYDTRHMRGRAINVAYMAGNVELLYPPPPPPPPDYRGHPMSIENFRYSE